MEDAKYEWADAMRDMAEQERLRPLLDEASALFGPRLTDSYFDGPSVVRLSVLDLDDGDTAAILAAARRLGIQESAMQIHPSDPAALDAWERLRHELDDLRLARCDALQMSPSTRQRFCHPPFSIHLTADAVDLAAQLHRSYGKFVVLRVGALGYPPAPDAEGGHQERDSASTADPHELRAELEGPLAIKSGQSAVHHVDVTNLGDRSLEIHTNGNITATIIDPVTGRTIGGYAGFQNLPLVVFPVASGETVRIPLLVGTASFELELGYTVPPGTWGLVAPLRLGDGRRLVSAAMEITVTG